MDNEDRRDEPDHDDSRAAEPPAEGADEGHSPGSKDPGSSEEPGPLGNPDVDEEAQSHGQQGS